MSVFSLRSHKRCRAKMDRELEKVRKEHAKQLEKISIDYAKRAKKLTEELDNVRKQEIAQLEKQHRAEMNRLQRELAQREHELQLETRKVQIMYKQWQDNLSFLNNILLDIAMLFEARKDTVDVVIKKARDIMDDVTRISQLHGELKEHAKKIEKSPLLRETLESMKVSD